MKFIYHMMVTLFFVLILTQFTKAMDIGDKLYISKARVNIRSSPSEGSSIVVRIDKGHVLIELATSDSWINVGVDRTGGKSGWVKKSNVSYTYIQGGSQAPYDPRFDKFSRAVEILNNNVEKRIGQKFFSKVENLGDGMVSLTPTAIWLQGDEKSKKKNLHTIFMLWEAAEGTGLPVAVYIVDSGGNILMKESNNSTILN